MKNETYKTGIIYCRVSSQEQTLGTSLEMQKKQCIEYAVRNGIEIVVEPFMEEGESAKTANRTQFKKALNYCMDKKNKVGFFIVHKLDRFARNQDDHAMTQAVLKKFGVKLRSVTEQIDDTPVGRAMEGVLSVFAEFDNNVRAARSKSGMQEKVSDGFWVWAAPFGYKRLIKGGNLVPDEPRSDYVRLAFKEFSTGTHSFASLAKYLSDRGMRRPNGSKPTESFMQSLISNRIYSGVMCVWGGEYKGKFEPLIDEELFWKCQPSAVKRASMKKRAKENGNFPLRKFAICSECSKPLTGSASTGCKGTKYLYYHHHKQDCLLASSIPKDVLEAAFVSLLRKISPTAKYEQLFKAIVRDVWQKNYQELDKNNSTIRKDIEKIEKDRQEIFDLHRARIYSDDDFIEQKRKIDEKMWEKRQLLQDNQVEEFDMDSMLYFSFEFIRDGATTWKSLENFPVLRSQFQKQIFPKNIIFDGNKFETSELSIIHKLNQESDGENTDLVTPRRVELRLTD